MAVKYTSALFQIILVGFVCFCCPGMFNVLNSIGGGGLVDDPNVSRNANVALNVTFALFGIIGGGIVNIVGSKWSIAISGLGYAFYSASFLIFSATGAGWVVILAGALLGACAGVLWAAQGRIMMSYATDEVRGKYISITWIIFNLGSVLGNIIPFSLNFNSASGKLGNGTYIGLIVVMLVGCAISLGLAPIEKVVRHDGSPVKVTKYENILSEAIEVLKVFLNWKMVVLVPLFVASNYFYTYQWDIMNYFVFNLRTRSFNNIWYWAAQMVGAYGMGKLLDYPKMKRSSKGLIGLAALTISFTAVWGGALAFQLQFTAEDNPFKAYTAPTASSPGVDFTSSNYGGLIVLYLLFGLLDAMLQTLAYWIMGSLHNDALILTRYAGFYKGIQSAGAAVAWGVSTTSASYLTQLIICWVLLEVSVPGAFLVVRSLEDYNLSEVPKESFDHELNSKS
ncbi:MFS general substrate transporter [Neoconidiobolus thromboides FSU 785]|nr:MFS general substrate transporter [Neoconidiobolus thromboides FSU 785]